MASKSVNTSPGRCRNSPHSSGRPGCAGVYTSCSTSGRRVQMSVPRGRKSRPTCAEASRLKPQTAGRRPRAASAHQRLQHAGLAAALAADHRHLRQLQVARRDTRLPRRGGVRPARQLGSLGCAQPRRALARSCRARRRQLRARGALAARAPGRRCPAACSPAAPGWCPGTSPSLQPAATDARTEGERGGSGAASSAPRRERPAASYGARRATQRTAPSRPRCSSRLLHSQRRSLCIAGAAAPRCRRTPWRRPRARRACTRSRSRGPSARRCPRRARARRLPLLAAPRARRCQRRRAPRPGPRGPKLGAQP